MSSQIALSPISLLLGGTTLTFIPKNSPNKFIVQSSHIPFLGNRSRSDIQIEVYTGKLPKFPKGDLVFQSGGTWELYRIKEEWIFRFYFLNGKKCLKRILKINADFSRGKLFIGPFPASFQIDKQSPRFLVAYPLDELLLVHYFAHNRLGAVIHAFGIKHDGEGYAFIGASGAGKSTLARLWQNAGDLLLSDDRLILRKGKRELRVFGTPWHGDADAAAPLHAPLKKIYFLAKSKQNYLHPLEPIDAVKRLIVCSFPPFHDVAGMSFIIDFFTQIVSEIPCFELGVVPNSHIIDFVYQNS